MSIQASQTLFLGAGGSSPRVERLCPDGTSRTAISLPPGHSVYALEMDPTETKLAVGTRMGFIFVLPLGNGLDAEDHLAEPVTLIQGSPILDLAWLDELHLAACDQAGRLLFWDLRNETEPRLANTRDRFVCSLARLGGNGLACLSADGRLTIWDEADGRLVEEFPLVSPPPLLALVKLVYQAESKTLIYPGSQGRLVRSGLDGKHNLIQAHQGDLYAFCSHRAGITTFGLHDGQMKSWDMAGGGPERIRKTVKGAICAEVFTEDPLQVTLIVDDGRVCIHLIENQETEVSEALPGAGFRLVTGPGRRSDRPALTPGQIHDLVIRIQEAASSQDDPESGRLHDQLIKAGYEHVSLALKTDQEVSEGKYLEALASSQRLIQLLPVDDSRTVISLTNHARLLARFGLLEEILRIETRLLSLAPEADLISMGLAAYPQEIRSLLPILDPACSLAEIFEAREIVGSRSSMDLVVRKLDPLSCPWAKITAKEIEEAHNQSLTKEKASGSPWARSSPVCWVSERNFELSEMAFFEEGIGSNDLQFALRITGGENQTLLWPVILFRWNPEAHDQASDQEAGRLLDQAISTSATSHHLDAVCQAAMKTIRKMATAAAVGRGV